MPPAKARKVINQGMLDEIKRTLQNNHIAVLFYLDIVKFQEITQNNGRQVANDILECFWNTLNNNFNTDFIPELNRIIEVESLWGDDFIVLAEAAHNQDIKKWESIAAALIMKIKNDVDPEVIRLTGNPLEIHCGYASITGSPENMDIKFYTAIRKAYGIAKGYINAKATFLLKEFKNILNYEKLHMVYQPIVSLLSGGVLGWETLLRGPEKSYFAKPDIIFQFAEHNSLLFQLEKICHKLAISGIGEIGTEQKLFINVHPHSVSDPLFAGGETLRMLYDSCVKPRNIVFEITEKGNISDFTSFNRTLANYREQGCLIAVDDVGSGHSCLRSIAELKPDFIKIDMSLVSDIQHNHTKAALMETFITFTKKIGSEIIAEGIENAEELETLIKLGVHYGQGYFLRRPAFPKPLPDEVSCSIINKFNGNTNNRMLKQHLTVGEFAIDNCCVDMDTRVETVKEIFESQPSVAGIVVMEKGKPAGLVMRHHLDRKLGKKFGVPLYYKKPVSNVMDHSPLIIADNLALENVAQIAMNRQEAKLYDLIIVTRKGQFQGTVSVQTILDIMTKIRIEIAKGANPLTGLPGNMAIEQELARRANEKHPFCAIFCDLDHFKSFNDKYGFEAGDKVLLFTADLLQSVIRKYSKDDFVGHVGGDDFIMITRTETADEVCQRIIRYFDKMIIKYYEPEDGEKGYILGKDRDGKKKKFPLISISIALVECSSDNSYDIKTISSQVATLKRYAKSRPGSLYVRDRRCSL